jgi:hypothetical protein
MITRKKKGSPEAELIAVQFELDDLAGTAYVYFRGTPTLKRLRMEYRKLNEYQGLTPMCDGLWEQPSELSQKMGITRWYLGQLW